MGFASLGQTIIIFGIILVIKKIFLITFSKFGILTKLPGNFF